MKNHILKLSALALALVLSAGCATTASEVTADEAMAAAQQAQATAQEALQTANRALQVAQEANQRSMETDEKINRMFQRSMFK